MADYTNKLPLLASLLLCISLVACKQQSTINQSSSTPSSNPPSGSAAPSNSNPSSSQASSSQRPSSRQAESQQSESQQTGSQPPAPSTSGNRQTEPGAPSASQGSDSERSQSAPGQTPDQQRPDSGGMSDASGGPADSSLYDSYDPSQDETGEGTQGQSGQQTVIDNGPLTQGSDQERQAALEAELEGSIGQYDDMILRERDYVLNREAAKGAGDQIEEDTPPGQGGGNGSNGSGNSSDINPYGVPGSPSGAEEVADNGNAKMPGRGSRPGSPNPGQSAPPADIPDGNDDDVVARQIREAAMNEKDPELRAKLWQEYRKYKNQ